MQGGIHLLSGLLLASLSKRKEYKVGAVFGAILPDIDLFIAAIAYLFIGEKATILHRSFTHSFFDITIFSLLLFLFGVLVRFKFPDKKLAKYDYTGFSLGIFIGMNTHVILDLFYLVKVQIFWPFSKQWIGWPLVPDSKLSVLALKILQATDFLTDIFLFIIPMVYLSYKENKYPRIRKFFIGYIFVDIATIIFYIFFAFNRSIAYYDYLVYLYYPGIFFLVTSVFSPLIFRDVIRDFNYKPHVVGSLLFLFVFSQFLFVLPYIK